MPPRPPQWLIGSAICSRQNSRTITRCRRLASTTTELAEPDIYDVVCVGGGPAGLSLLAGLQSSPTTSGLRVALVEGLDLKRNILQNASPSTFSNRCSSLTPASVQYLKDIGAWGYVDESRVQPYHEMQVWDGLTGARIAFDWTQASKSLFPSSQHQATSGAVAFMIENVNITTALQRRLAALGSTDMFSPARVEAITFGSDTSTADLRTWPIVHLSTGRRLAARLLVGADGANSPVRTFANITSRGWDYNRHGVVATLRISGPGRGGPGHKIAYQRFLPTGPIALLPLPGELASLVWSTLPERAATLRSLQSRDFVALVNAAFRLSAVDLTYLHGMSEGQAEEVPWRIQHVQAEEEKLPVDIVGVQEGSIAPFPLKMRHADSYTAERIALVGDAAHTIHPLAGQGLNQGQADAASLACTIAAAVQTGQDIGAQIPLSRYDADRYAANNALLGICDKLHKLYSVESEPIVGLRSLGLRAVDRVSAAKEFLMTRAAGI